LILLQVLMSCLPSLCVVGTLQLDSLTVPEFMNDECPAREESLLSPLLHPRNVTNPFSVIDLVAETEVYTTHRQR
jgi:hypothetical protein